MMTRWFVWISLLLCVAFPQHALSATKKITLQSETCSYVFSYDAKKFEKRQLEDTFEMVVMPRWAETFSSSVFSAKDVDALKPDEVAQQCKASLNKVKSFKLIELDGIEQLRRSALERLEDSCAFHKILIAGHRNPTALRDYTPAASCSRFVDALEGKTDLTVMFDTVLQETCRDNADTKACIDRRNTLRGDIPEMRVEVTTFGWNNCAVDFLKFNTNNQRDDALRRKLADVFFKQFKAREEYCDEP
jgi:hypothetical protein